MVSLKSCFVKFDFDKEEVELVLAVEKKAKFDLHQVCLLEVLVGAQQMEMEVCHQV